MEEKSREQEMSAREISLIRELAQIRKEYKRELEYEKFDGYELPPRTQFSMLNKPAVSIKYGVMKFNMACIRLFEGIKYVLPILHPNKKRLALIMCPEEDLSLIHILPLKNSGLAVISVSTNRVLSLRVRHLACSMRL